jgi:outer membrane protein insertion porin family
VQGGNVPRAFRQYLDSDWGGMVTAIKASNLGARATATLLAGTILSGVVTPANAQTAATPAVPAAQAQATPAPATPAVVRTVKSLRVEGSQRIEPETVLSYTRLRVGDSYTNETIDQAIKDLLASELLADVVIEGVESGNLILRIRENPVINRVVFEGNKRLKQDKIDKEIKLKPRQIFTRTAVRADIARIIELYRRQGRFAARVEPKMVSLDQNRVDLIFEIHEGSKSKVRQINIIGNEVFSDKKLRAQMATKVASLSHFLSSNTSYDQDRLAYDQQKLRQYYLTEGYADFRVISAVAELTPDKKDFIITYVVEEGPRYKFGPVSVDSAIRDFDDKKLASALPIKEGQWYNAKTVEDTIEQLSETAGLFGYAFADVRPDYQRNKDALTMSINFHIGEANRTYIERVDITGNRQTQDKVIRREMRVAEGDAFNTFLVKRSQDRINSLGYFQDKFEIERKEGSAPDRIVLGANVEEKPNGELTLSAGFSSLERFILQASIRQRNFRGMGQTASISADYSSYSKSVELGFTEPYLFDSNIALGATIFRRDYNSFNYLGTTRNTTYQQVSTGFQLVAGLPLTEYWTLSGRYYLAKDNVTLDQSTFYTNGQCDPLKAGRYYCEAVGNRLTSLVGLSLIYDSLNSRLRPTRGHRVSVGVDAAGLGGDVHYLRGRVDGAKYWGLGSGFVFSLTGEGGVIKSVLTIAATRPPARSCSTPTRTRSSTTRSAARPITSPRPSWRSRWVRVRRSWVCGHRSTSWRVRCSPSASLPPLQILCRRRTVPAKSSFSTRTVRRRCCLRSNINSIVRASRSTRSVAVPIRGTLRPVPSDTLPRLPIRAWAPTSTRNIIRRLHRFTNAITVARPRRASRWVSASTGIRRSGRCASILQRCWSASPATTRSSSLST